MLEIAEDHRNFLDEREAAIGVFKKKHGISLVKKRCKAVQQQRRKQQKRKSSGTVLLKKKNDIEENYIDNAKEKQTIPVNNAFLQELATQRSSKVKRRKLEF